MSVDIIEISLIVSINVFLPFSKHLHTKSYRLTTLFIIKHAKMCTFNICPYLLGQHLVSPKAMDNSPSPYLVEIVMPSIAQLVQ